MVMTRLRQQRSLGKYNQHQFINTVIIIQISIISVVTMSYSNQHTCIKNTVPLSSVTEGVFDVGEELTVSVSITRSLTCGSIRILDSFIATTFEVFVSNLRQPSCQKRGIQLICYRGSPLTTVKRWMDKCSSALNDFGLCLSLCIHNLGTENSSQMVYVDLLMLCPV